MTYSLKRYNLVRNNIKDISQDYIMKLRNGKSTNNIQNLTLEIKEIFSQNKVVKLRKIIKKKNRKLNRRSISL